MKLIIQIPCLNEEKTLPVTIKDLPRSLEGVNEIETLIIDDGSTDRTVEVARSLGVNHIISLTKQRGLAYAFKKGIDRALELGADIIVNTDGDNQYKGEDIALLVKPIVERKAEIVIGARDMSSIKHFSFVKRWLQGVGSHVVRRLSKTNIPDVTSGFRAYSRDAAMRINIFSDYTYTLESIIQAGKNNLHIDSVEIRTNSKLRESRLISSTAKYVVLSAASILRIYLMYEPLKSFVMIGLVPIIAGSVLVIRFLIDHFTRASGGHVQSMMIAVAAIMLGFGIMMIGLLGDIISANRKLNEEVLYKLKKK